MIYRLGRFLFGTALRQFFTKIQVCGATPIEHGPVLIVANHPNFFIDSLLVCTVFKRDLWFLAKSTLFKGGMIDWVLNQAHLVPVYRRQDNPIQMKKNEDTFRFASAVLEQGRGVVIFPEGVSLGERELSPIKTGAARIALLAEDAQGFKLGLKLQPVGLTYTDFDRFRSNVTLTFGETLTISQFKVEYEADAARAVRQLTERIDQALRDVTVEVKEREHVELIENIARLYSLGGSSLDDFERMKIVAKNVEAVGPTLPEKKAELVQRISEYIELAASLGQHSDVVKKIDRFSALLLSPLVFIGVAFHFVPYRLTGRLARELSSEPVSLGSTKLVVGLALFLFWYLGWLVGLLLCVPGSVAVLTILFLGAAGHSANRFFYSVKLAILSSLWPGDKDPAHVLEILREQLIEELEALRVE